MSNDRHRGVGRLVDQLDRNEVGAQAGVYCTCSANPSVLRASLEQAKEQDGFCIVESTCNQVNQFGGYTGMKPKDFVKLVYGIADKVGLDHDLIVLGGDHLGPEVWKKEPAEDAMAKSKELVAAYVRAGYTKIHLDASMHCADDNPEMPLQAWEGVVADRAGTLCRVVVDTLNECERELSDIVLVVGSEVPPPGGARIGHDEVRITPPDEVARTLRVFREAFERHQVAEAWSRVIGLVVQPGVEFGHDSVLEYDPSKARGLSQEIKRHDSVLYEAHSTDYQTNNGLGGLVRGHFAVLKVGPEQTFAFREALFALAEIEEKMVPEDKASQLREVVEQVMLEDTSKWASHYPGDDFEQKLLRQFSFSDRIRYYWPQAKVQEAIEKLYANLREEGIPLHLLSQYLGKQYDAVRSGAVKADPEEIVIHRIKMVNRKYAVACGLTD